MVNAPDDGPGTEASVTAARRGEADTLPSDCTDTRSSFPEPREGDVLKGKYRLESKLGEGGMGVVYRAVDLDVPNSTSYVAIKLLKPKLRTRAARIALSDEVELTRKLKSENIVGVYSFEQDAGTAFMVMEFLEGRSLDKNIAEEYALGRPFKVAWPIIQGMGDALTEAHRHNIVHSDFKPSNVLITAGPTKVLDFGIARALGRPLMGLTEAYASRDMFLDMPSDHRDDVYSFGLVVYELLSGKHPFRDDDGRKLPATEACAARMPVSPIRGLNSRQNAALKDALQFERAKRTGSIQEVLDALQRPTSPKWLWFLVCALLVVVAGMAAYGVYRRLGPQDSYAQFVEYFQRDCSAQTNAGADPETVAQLLDLAHDYLRDGVQPFNPGLLSENGRPLSNALSAFLAVQKTDCANVSATQGVFAIVNAYETEARRLRAARQFKQALEMTEIALKIWPSSVDLKTMDNTLRREVAASGTQPKITT